jgi:hypothetical protein
MHQVICQIALCMMLGFMPAPQTPSNEIFAQKLVDETVAKHAEVNVIGLHASTEHNFDGSHIIAHNNRAKVGKKSDPDDIEVEKTGKPAIERRDDKGVFDIGMPLVDQSGKTIGTAVIEIKYKYISTESEALTRATKIQEELKKQIPSKSRLFEKVE